ncbi:hypothetical protein AOLI_G00121220 [Acnodon oligacanthus]
MRRGNSLAVYLVNLSISDLLYIISLPVWIMLAMKQPVDDTLCSLINVIMYNSFYVGSGLLCCISMDRYLAVVFPLYFHTAHKVQTAVLVSILVWLVEISLHAGLLRYTGDMQHFSPARLCDVKQSMTIHHAHMAIIRVVLGFLVPLLLMAFCFQQIIMSLRASVSTVASERRKIRNLLLLLLLIYMVAFAPFQVVMFLRGLLEPENCSTARQLRDYYMIHVIDAPLNITIGQTTSNTFTHSALNSSQQSVVRGESEPSTDAFSLQVCARPGCVNAEGQ